MTTTMPKFAVHWAARALLGAILVSLAGCAEHMIRQRSSESLAGGRYEEAVRLLEEGVGRYPESTALRTGLFQARAQAVSKRLEAAGQAISQGRWPEAEAAVQGALAVEPNNVRATALLADLQIAQRQQRALKQAQLQWSNGQADSALHTIEAALKDNPRHPELTALQRRIEQDQRAQAPVLVLAENRPISLDFRDAPLRTVLDVVSRNSGINFVLDRDIRSDARVTVFLREAKVEDALDLIASTNQLAKKVLDSQSILIYPNTPDKQRDYQEHVIRVFHLASADAKNAATFLKSMLKIREPFVDERSNMLALRDSPENIRLAERLVALFDAGEPEVLLEVEILEVSAARLTELGIKFPDSFSLTPLSPTGSAGGLTLGNVSGIDRDRVALGISGLLINLKREVGDSSTLANPRIRARNREKAKVMIGDRIPVVTSTTGSGGFVSDSVSYLDVGLKLEVEPTVYADDEVAIKVALEVSATGAAIRTSSGTLAYQIGTRNASTVLRLRDGETQLLAGLISRDERTSSSRVPGLGDLPVLGRLFSSQQDNGLRSELVLAITPRILRNIRRPDATESELWVGTEAAPRLRLPGPPRNDQQSLPPPGGAGGQGTGSAVTPAAAAQATRLGPNVAAVLPGSQAVAAEPSGVVEFAWQGPSEAKVGDTVELQVLIKTGQNLRGAGLGLTHNKQMLQPVEVTEGSFFSAGGAKTNFTTSIDQEVGRTRLGVMRVPVSGVVGEGVVAVLRFKVLSPGVATIALDYSDPVSMIRGAALQVRKETFSFRVQ